MTEAPKNIHPAVARSLESWHHMVASRDLSNLLSIVHPDAVFRSPMANTAYTSAPALMLAPALECSGIDLAEQAIHAAVPAEPQGMRPRCRCQCRPIAVPHREDVRCHSLGIIDRPKRAHLISDAIQHRSCRHTDDRQARSLRFDD